VGPGEPESLAGLRPLFLVWSPPARGARSRVLARELGIEQLHFIYLWRTQSLVTLPLRYLYRSLRTLHLLWRRRPRLVLIQSPPHLGVAVVLLYSILTGARYVVDAHGAAFQNPFWTRPRWLVRLLARRALVTLVTNEQDAGRMRRRGGRALVIPDIPWDLEPAGQGALRTGEFTVVLISSHSPDEPIGNVMQAAAALPEVRFHITGSRRRNARASYDAAPPNVLFRGFLEEKDFHGLLSRADAVLCLTTRAQTMQRGACEGLWMGKPLIVSDSVLLRDYFREGAVWVDNSPADIERAIREVRDHYASYRTGIQNLQRTRREEWQGRRRKLIRLLLAQDPVESDSML